MFQIVGLGNLDLKKTRHSVGMQVLDQIANKLDIRWQKHKQFIGMFTQKTLELGQSEMTLLLLKPRTSMNINGRSVSKVVQNYKIPTDHIYLIHDDLDKPVGKFSLKEKGSAR